MLVLALGLLTVPALGGGAPTPSGAAKPDTAPAVTAAQAWLQTMDNGDYAGSWDQAASYFRQRAEKNAWWSISETVRKPLGAVKSRRMTSAEPATRVPGGPDGQYVVIQFETSFVNRPKAIEIVTPMVDIDGTWRVSAYVIN